MRNLNDFKVRKIRGREMFMGFSSESGDLLFSCKGKFPFRLGTTSYIIPDDIIPNVRYLADKVDDVELVLFESEEISNLPSEAAVRELGEIGKAHALSYTIHLPLDTYLGDESETERRRSVEKCLRVMDLMGELSPFAYVLHFHCDREGPRPSGDMERWKSQHRKSVEELLKSGGGIPVAVETLSYPYHLIEDIVFDYGLSTCLDTGHLQLQGYDVFDHFGRYFDNTRVIHLHGVLESIDHRDISFVEEELLNMIVNEATGKRDKVVLTLEVFSESDLRSSFQILERYQK